MDHQPAHPDSSVPKRRHSDWRRFVRVWSLMSFYERFEQAVAIVLSRVIAAIIDVSLIQLIRIVFVLLLTEASNPLDHKVSQSAFGMMMTLLIALEFKHSIIRAALRRENIVHVKTVVLIALVAHSRNFVLLDMDTEPAKVAALSGAMLALGVVYWLMRERDDHSASDTEKAEQDSVLWSQAAPPTIGGSGTSFEGGRK